MSHYCGFEILPFDWRVAQKATIPLSIDVNDFAQRLQAECPSGNVEVVEYEGTSVRLYITRDDEPCLAAYLWAYENAFIMDVSAYPKSLAVKLILWYRHYVSAEYPLFLIVADEGDWLELTEHTSPQDVEAHFPTHWINLE